MTKTWARSAARPAGRGVRPAGSWAASVARARASWDNLTGGAGARHGALHGEYGVAYSDVAAAAILACAATLWADTAASLAVGEDDGEGDEMGG